VRTGIQACGCVRGPSRGNGVLEFTAIMAILPHATLLPGLGRASYTICSTAQFLALPWPLMTAFSLVLHVTGCLW
jgi:hypothetical protein